MNFHFLFVCFGWLNIRRGRRIFTHVQFKGTFNSRQNIYGFFKQVYLPDTAVPAAVVVLSTFCPLTKALNTMTKTLNTKLTVICRGPMFHITLLNL